MLQPATGATLTPTSPSRTIANTVALLEQVEQRLPAEAERVYVILDTLNYHHATDVRLFALAHPRWEFVFQPTYAAYLNLIELWWRPCARVLLLIYFLITRLLILFISTSFH